MNEIKSITVAELIKELKEQPQSWPVFTSVDPEGNAFGSLRADCVIGGSDEDKVLILYPIDTHMDDDIIPLQGEKIMAELEAQSKLK